MKRAWNACKEFLREYRWDVIGALGVCLVGVGLAMAWPPLCVVWFGAAAIWVAVQGARALG